MIGSVDNKPMPLAVRPKSPCRDEASRPHPKYDELCHLVCIPCDYVLKLAIDSMPGDVVQCAPQLELACGTYLSQGHRLNDVYDEFNVAMGRIEPDKRAEWMKSCFDALIQSDKSNKHPDKVEAFGQLMNNLEALLKILYDD
ncbi:MAG: hypothetical protein ISQ13_02785 [Candidatus Margulisbacteria bacterium]|nr:hypothetical protein [Candidatus Margulisiibacteriota bacterium]